ncbi:GntR family transcriptional regulator [Methylobacterium sp. JK268]
MSPPPAAASLAEALRQAILRGVHPAGARLSQDAVAAQYGTSQTVAREAFRDLAGKGILVAEPRRGVYVPALTREEVEEITRLRVLLEVQALAWAIRRPSPHRPCRGLPSTSRDERVRAWRGRALSAPRPRLLARWMRAPRWGRRPVGEAQLSA